MTYPSTTSRRRFLQVAAAATTLPSIVHCSGGGGASPAAVGDISAGAVSALTIGSLQQVGSHPVCIGRDMGGVYAMTLTCTHEGCDMGSEGTVSSSGISCNCHGSRFDVNGAVTRGPAESPLQHFAVSADASGNLTVHGGTTVDAVTRLKV